MVAVNTEENIAVSIDQKIIKPGDKVYYKDTEMIFVRVFDINGRKLPNILVCSWHDQSTTKKLENSFNITDLTVNPIRP